MNFYAISALINFFTSLILGVFVILKSRNSKNLSFFIFCFFVASWSLGYYFWQIADDAISALFWCRALMAAAILIPVSYLHFVYALVDLVEKRKKFLIFSYGLFSLFLLGDLTPYFVSHIEPILNFKYWPIAGHLYSVFLVVWFFYVVYSTFLLYDKYKKSFGIIRLQLKYVMLGMIIGFAGGSTNYLLWYRIPVLPVGNILVSIYVAFSAYAIIRYRLMDIRIVARRIFIYFGAGAFTYGFFYFTIWLYSRAFGGIFTSGAYAAGLVVAPLFVFGFYRIDGGLRKFANKYLFVSLYNYQETITRLTDELNNYIDLSKIINLIVETIKKTMQLDRAGVLLINSETRPISFQIAKVIGFNRQNGISLVQDNFLTRHLEKIQKPLVRDELTLLARDARSEKDKESIETLHGHMKKIEASLCLPLMSSKKLIGIIVLGAKISGDAYTSEDLELLNTLSKQAGIAIENARLYKQVGDFNKTLKDKVSVQTKDITAKNEELEKKAKELKDGNEYLKKLLAMRSEFLDTASHQLRTPVSVIKGMLSMILEGGMPKDKIDEFLKASFEKSVKLTEIINDILRASETESEKFNLSFQSADLKEVLQKIVEDKKILAEKKGISLKLLLAGKISPVMIDEKYMTEAIGNLVDNSIKYTVKGGVFIKAEEKERMIFIRVSDTGIGIPKEDEPKLFDKFVRAKNAVNAYADGTGLGLYIVKKIITMHKGANVEIEWTEENKGTTFLITLPTV
ncbi:MAG: ATP-binding protein [Patescibacteria group bacterium]|jgi:signal transduction histidine kinase